MFDILINLANAPITNHEIIKRVTSGEDLRLIDLNVVRRNYHELKSAFHYAKAYTAVKATTTAGILEILNAEGSNFEIATIEELRECLRRNIDARRIIFSHPAKDAVEIAEAYKYGVTTYISDSEEDLNLIAKHAPGAKVIIRIKTANDIKCYDTLTEFNMRFGVSNDYAQTLLIKGQQIGLHAYGLCFHVGTQRECTSSWDATIKNAALIFKNMAAQGINLQALDIGGGFPSNYKIGIPTPKEFGAAIESSISQHFKGLMPKEIIIEPGRSISAMSGITIGRVINVKPAVENNDKYIVTISTGKFSAGLFNVGNGMYFYRANDNEAQLIASELSNNADIYGKACASFDQPIEGSAIRVPRCLRSGDMVVFTGTGAYSGEMVTRWCSKDIPTTIVFDNMTKVC